MSSGCSEGPLWRLGAYNPWVLQKWEEENQYAISLHARRKQIADLRRSAVNGDPQQQQQATDQLLRLLDRQQPLAIRLDVVDALAKLPNAAAYEALRSAAKDPDAEIRQAACQSLGHHQFPETIKVLQEVIGSDTDIDVRLAATRALENFQGPEAVSALGLALDDREPAMQFRAMESLAKVTGQDFGHRVRQWQGYVQEATGTHSGGPALANRPDGTANR